MLVSRTILLDSGPLGLITNPGAPPMATACGCWVVNAIDRGVTILVPEIADCELRRELIRARRTAGVARLDAFIAQAGLLPIATAAIRQASVFWAEARRKGRPSAPDPALDDDDILAAQAATLDRTGVIVATTNPKHLSQYVPAEPRIDIASSRHVIGSGAIECKESRLFA